ncbi:hypothetical protein TNCV_1629041 [Trichonephila clavipes]|uniref:Uncharacterized protein n=1 Tax=Trichonephila clavipes TaxID=2585209 RepID=A0A8X7BGZ0_TRICX|nr:hypothetical protein TNCV_1629041 [Trichonephila clavipes]
MTRFENHVTPNSLCRGSVSRGYKVVEVARDICAACGVGVIVERTTRDYNTFRRALICGDRFALHSIHQNFFQRNIRHYLHIAELTGQVGTLTDELALSTNSSGGVIEESHDGLSQNPRARILFYSKGNSFIKICHTDVGIWLQLPIGYGQELIVDESWVRVPMPWKICCVKELMHDTLREAQRPPIAVVVRRGATSTGVTLFI